MNKTEKDNVNKIARVMLHYEQQQQQQQQQQQHQQNSPNVQNGRHQNFDTLRKQWSFVGKTGESCFYRNHARKGPGYVSSVVQQKQQQLLQQQQQQQNQNQNNETQPWERGRGGGCDGYEGTGGRGGRRERESRKRERKNEYYPQAPLQTTNNEARYDDGRSEADCCEECYADNASTNSDWSSSTYSCQCCTSSSDEKVIETGYASDDCHCLSATSSVTTTCICCCSAKEPEAKCCCCCSRCCTNHGDKRNNTNKSEKSEKKSDACKHKSKKQKATKNEKRSEENLQPITENSCECEGSSTAAPQQDENSNKCREHGNNEPEQPGAQAIEATPGDHNVNDTNDTSDNNINNKEMCYCNDDDDDRQRQRTLAAVDENAPANETNQLRRSGRRDVCDVATSNEDNDCACDCANYYTYDCDGNGGGVAADAPCAETEYAAKTDDSAGDTAAATPATNPDEAVMEITDYSECRDDAGIDQNKTEVNETPEYNQTDNTEPTECNNVEEEQVLKVPSNETPRSTSSNGGNGAGGGGGGGGGGSTGGASNRKTTRKSSTQKNSYKILKTEVFESETITVKTSSYINVRQSTSYREDRYDYEGNEEGDDCDCGCYYRHRQQQQQQYQRQQQEYGTGGDDDDLCNNYDSKEVLKIYDKRQNQKNNNNSNSNGDAKNDEACDDSFNRSWSTSQDSSNRTGGDRSGNRRYCKCVSTGTQKSSTGRLSFTCQMPSDASNIRIEPTNKNDNTKNAKNKTEPKTGHVDRKDNVLCKYCGIVNCKCNEPNCLASQDAISYSTSATSVGGRRSKPATTTIRTTSVKPTSKKQQQQVSIKGENLVKRTKHTKTCETEMHQTNGDGNGERRHRTRKRRMVMVEEIMPAPQSPTRRKTWLVGEMFRNLKLKCDNWFQCRQQQHHQLRKREEEEGSVKLPDNCVLVFTPSPVKCYQVCKRDCNLYVK